MALKYTIVYGDYSRYHQKRSNKKLARNLSKLLLSIAFVTFVVCSPVKNKLYNLFLPGEPTVTMDALNHFVEALDSGETLLDAFDVFCQTVMDVK
jgi:hypothetical protein